MIYIITINDKQYCISTNKYNKFLLTFWITLSVWGIVLYFQTADNLALIDEQCYYSSNEFHQADFYIDDVIRELDNITLVSQNSTIYENINIVDYRKSLLLSGMVSFILAPVGITYYPESVCITQNKFHIIFCILTLTHFSLCTLEYIFLISIIFAKRFFPRKKNDAYIMMQLPDS